MIDYDVLRNWRFERTVRQISERDVILYALAVGYGADPVDERQLRFVYERDLVAAPTMASVLGHTTAWMRDPATGIDGTKVVHAGQSVRLHAQLPVSGTVVAEQRVRAIVDKGPDTGALVYIERTVSDEATATLLATVDHVSLCRADGGFQGREDVPTSAVELPKGAPELICDLSTIPQAALVYRLCGDLNPLHVDPTAARAAGFERPILHGLCTYGVAGHAIIRTLCDYDPANLVALSGRFSAPVFPGETLRTEMWKRGGGCLFRVRALERNAVVLTDGIAEIDLDGRGAGR